MPKLTDLFVGILDFFAILLPGAIATAVLIAQAEPALNQRIVHGLFLVPVNETAAWAMFAVASYFLGHLIFMAGSWLDGLFHTWREFRYHRHVDMAKRRRRRERRNATAPKRKRWPYLRKLKAFLKRWCRKQRKTDTLFECATRVRNLRFQTPDEQNAINTFQWARSVLIEKFPAAATDVHRLEADSKFFRSLVVLSLLLSLHLLINGHIRDGFLSALLFAVCIVRYGSRRLKSERQAYIHKRSRQRGASSSRLCRLCCNLPILPNFHHKWNPEPFFRPARCRRTIKRSGAHHGGQ